ncbi:MAG TPA: dihydrodipicolinate synthase family protein [Rhabdochlamydiaceae bacterium]|nr:dihydrodipicolinate synthase family protein [Rhabdochlamydiaceae bacterium]
MQPYKLAVLLIGLLSTLKAITMEKFTGIYAASLTPLHADLSCDYDAYAVHCKELIEQGCSGVVLFGTTGEGPSFSVAERQEGIQALVERGVDPKKIIVSVGCPSVEDTITLTQAALAAKCAAVLMTPPYFFKNVSDAGIIAFYREVIRKVNNPDLKIFLYHIPQFSGVRISLDVIRTLHEEFPTTVIGMKESEGNFELTSAVLKQFPNLQLLVGSEKMIADAVSLGATGGISGIANICPQLICSLYKSKERQPEIEALSAVLKNYPFIPAIKSLLAQKKGSSWNMLRPPLVPLSSNESIRFAEDVQTCEQTH